jgi:hypothetical protein
MSAPPEFRQSRSTWFRCPHCGHRSYIAFEKAKVSTDSSQILQHFWCEKCGSYARLKRTFLATILGLVVVGPILFLILYRLVLEAISGSWSVYSLTAIVLAIAAAIGLPRLITRATNKYVPAQKSEL